MNIALDTNTYTKFIYYNDPSVVRMIGKAKSLALPVIVLAELKAGFAGGSKLQQNTHTLEAFLKDSRCVVLSINAETTDHYAHLKNVLRLQGTPIPANDLWIAALVSQYDYSLVTDDKHFDNLPELPRLNL